MQKLFVALLGRNNKFIMLQFNIICVTVNCVNFDVTSHTSASHQKTATQRHTSPKCQCAAK